MILCSVGTQGICTSTVAQEVLSVVLFQIISPTSESWYLCVVVFSSMEDPVMALKRSTAYSRLLEATTRTDASPLSGLPMMGVKVFPL